ncbi:MAG: hypothetical protein Q6363_001655 [Candidatus Njordarchaeota archaeon]
MAVWYQIKLRASPYDSSGKYYPLDTLVSNVLDKTFFHVVIGRELPIGIWTNIYLEIRSYKLLRYDRLINKYPYFVKTSFWSDFFKYPREIRTLILQLGLCIVCWVTMKLNTTYSWYPSRIKIDTEKNTITAMCKGGTNEGYAYYYLDASIKKLSKKPKKPRYSGSLMRSFYFHPTF